MAGHRGGSKASGRGGGRDGFARNKLSGEVSTVPRRAMESDEFTDQGDSNKPWKTSEKPKEAKTIAPKLDTSSSGQKPSPKHKNDKTVSTKSNPAADATEATSRQAAGMKDNSPQPQSETRNVTSAAKDKAPIRSSSRDATALTKSLDTSASIELSSTIPPPTFSQIAVASKSAHPERTSDQVAITEAVGKFLGAKWTQDFDEFIKTHSRPTLLEEPAPNPLSRKKRKRQPMDTCYDDLVPSAKPTSQKGAVAPATESAKSTSQKDIGVPAAESDVTKVLPFSRRHGGTHNSVPQLATPNNKPVGQLAPATKAEITRRVDAEKRVRELEAEMNKPSNERDENIARLAQQALVAKTLEASGLINQADALTKQVDILTNQVTLLTTQRNAGLGREFSLQRNIVDLGVTLEEKESLHEKDVASLRLKADNAAARLTQLDVKLVNISRVLEKKEVPPPNSAITPIGFKDASTSTDAQKVKPQPQIKIRRDSTSPKAAKDMPMPPTKGSWQRNQSFLFGLLRVTVYGVCAALAYSFLNHHLAVPSSPTFGQVSSVSNQARPQDSPHLASPTTFSTLLSTYALPTASSAPKFTQHVVVTKFMEVSPTVCSTTISSAASSATLGQYHALPVPTPALMASPLAPWEGMEEDREELEDELEFTVFIPLTIQPPPEPATKPTFIRWMINPINSVIHSTGGGKSQQKSSFERKPRIPRRPLTGFRLVAATIGFPLPKGAW